MVMVLVHRLGPYTEGKGRQEKEADHCDKQGGLHARLVLGNLRTSRSPHLPARS